MVKQSIVPAIIPDDRTMLTKRLEAVRGVVRTVQVDVMDGSYTATCSWPYEGVARDMFMERRTEDAGLPLWQELDLEIDCMVREPSAHVESWVLAGASRIVLHVESAASLTEAIGRCQASRVEVALAVKPSTKLDVLEPYLDQAVFVQCMGSDTLGRHGVGLDPAAVEQVRAIKARWPDVLIGVDIGVNTSTIRDLYDAGARRFAAGSAVFRSASIPQAIQSLEACLPV